MCQGVFGRWMSARYALANVTSSTSPDVIVARPASRVLLHGGSPTYISFQVVGSTR